MIDATLPSGPVTLPLVRGAGRVVFVDVATELLGSAVIVVRHVPADNCSCITYRVIIDGGQVGPLPPSHSCVIRVRPYQRYVVELRRLWLRSRTVFLVLEPGQEAWLVCRDRHSDVLSWLYYRTIGARRSIVLDADTRPS